MDTSVPRMNRGGIMGKGGRTGQGIKDREKEGRKEREEERENERTMRMETPIHSFPSNPYPRVPLSPASLIITTTTIIINLHTSLSLHDKSRRISSGEAKDHPPSRKPRGKGGAITTH